MNWTRRKHLQKKAPVFFLYFYARVSHLRQLLWNLGLKEISGFPSSPIYLVKSLTSTALSLFGSIFVKHIHLNRKTLHMYECGSRVLILYHELKSIPWVMSIPWSLANTRSLCLHHDSFSLPRVQVDCMIPSLYHEPKSDKGQSIANGT